MNENTPPKVRTAEEEILAAIQNLQKEVATLRSDLNQIRVCIIGDRLTGVFGLVDMLETHRRSIYGNPPTKDIGIKEVQDDHTKRIEVLEGSKAAVIAWSAGVSSGTVGLWAIIERLTGQ